MRKDYKAIEKEFTSALAWDFLFWFFAQIQSKRPKNSAFEYSWFNSWICQHIWLVHRSVVTLLTWKPIPCQLNQCQMRLHITWVNAESDFTSTESTQNDEIFIDLVETQSHSELIESMRSLTQRWFGWWQPLTPCWLGVWKTNWTNTGIHNHRWHLQRNIIIKIMHETFKWVQILTKK